MIDESFLQETNKEIWRHLYTSLHAFLNLHDSKICPQGELFIFKSYCPVQSRHVCLIKSVDPVVYKLKKLVVPLCFAPARL